LNLFSSSALFALLQVLLINVVLSGDNVIVIGTVAARVQPQLRPKVIAWGLGSAIALRVLLALLAVDLLAILGLTLAGGLLLLWVAWRLYRDASAGGEAQADGPSGSARTAVPVSFGRAIVQVAIADISMSIDNALAVAGAANQNVPVLVIGLVLSVAIMVVAANYVAKLLQRYPWMTYVGVLLVLYISLSMIWRGSGELPQLLHRL
jgi:YjbE family integral membrane protein